MNDFPLTGGGRRGASSREEVNAHRESIGQPPLSPAEFAHYVVGPAGFDIDDAQPLWDAERLYQPRAAVTEAGSFYRARRSSRGERPSGSPDAWAIVVQGVDLTFADQVKAEVEELAGQKIDEVRVAGDEKIGEAAGQVELARQRAEASALAAGASDAARALSEAARAEAQAARDAAFSNAAVFASVAEGLAGTSDGDQFQVSSGDYILRYRNDDGTAVEVSRLRSGASLSAVDNTADLAKPVSAAQLDSDREAAFRASLWRFIGYGDPATAPLVATEDGRVLIPRTVVDAAAVAAAVADAESRMAVAVSVVDARTSEVDNTADLDKPVSLAQAEAVREAAFRAALWRFVGKGDPATAPSLVSEDGRVIFSAEWPAAGGGPASPVPSVVDLLAALGQSNEEYASTNATSLVYGSVAHPSILTLLRGTAADTWLGQVTGGGASLRLLPESITGMGPAVPQMSATGRNGSGAIDGFTRRWFARKGRRVLTWTLAEGGQSIYNLLDGAPEGYWAAKNIETALTKAMEHKPAGTEIVWRWLLMHQGESNRGTAALAELHDQARRECEQKAQRILGQTEPLRMVTWQFSSTNSENRQGMNSLLTYALAHDASAPRVRTFFCGGPCYGFPWSGDYLHHSSVGHAMRGEAAHAVAVRVEDEGYFLPLHATKAEVTGEFEITVTLSEAAISATDPHVDEIEHLGVVLVGATIEEVAVNGTSVVITTANAAAGATAVHFGQQRHGATRARETIPRTNIRAVRPLGAYSDALRAAGSGSTIHCWMSHQIVNLT